MYEYFAFVDESVSKSYILCLVFIPTGKLHETRAALSKLRLKGQSRLHMQNENDRRRREILNSMMDLSTWNCVILQTRIRKANYIEARERLFLLAALTPEFATIRKIVVELSNEYERDKRVLTAIRKANHSDFEFSFEKSSSEECLWLADALAWAFARGGNTRKKIRNRIQVIATEL